MSAPCDITFERMGSMVGAAMTMTVYLNGFNVGAVKNGKTIRFQTKLRYNTVYVADHLGTFFQDFARFEAAPGGTIQLRFNRRFQ